MGVSQNTDLSIDEKCVLSNVWEHINCFFQAYMVSQYKLGFGKAGRFQVEEYKLWFALYF